MQIKRRYINQAVDFLTFLYGISTKESIKRFQFIKLLQDEAEATTKQYEKIGDDHAVKDEKGKPKTNPVNGNYLFRPDVEITGPEAVKDLLDDEAEIDEKIHKVKLEIIRKAVFNFDHKWKEGQHQLAHTHSLLYDLLDCEALEEEPPKKKAKKKKKDEE